MIGAWEITQPCGGPSCLPYSQTLVVVPHDELDILLHMGLSTLPYDLLLNIALFLDLSDIHALHLVRHLLTRFSVTSNFEFQIRPARL